MVLRQHRRHPVPLGRKLEQREEVVFFIDVAHPRAVVDINGRHLVLGRVGADSEILESKAFREVEQLLRIGLHRVAVEHHVADVHILCRQRYVVTVGCRAHCEEETAPHHKVAYLVAHGQFQLAYFLIAKLMSTRLLVLDILDVPLRVAVVAPELAVLARKVLVVQVQPVVLRQGAGHDLLVVDHVVGYLGVGHHQRDGVVPRQFGLGRIDGNLGCLLQAHGVHIDRSVSYFAQYGCRLAVGDDLDADATQARLALQGVGILHHKRAAAIVEQPRHFHLALQRKVGYAVGLQVVALRLVHRHQQVAGTDRQNGSQHNQKRIYYFFQHNKSFSKTDNNSASAPRITEKYVFYCVAQKQIHHLIIRP